MELLAEMNTRDRSRIADALKPMKFEMNDVIIREGMCSLLESISFCILVRNLSSLCTNMMLVFGNWRQKMEDDDLSLLPASFTGDEKADFFYIIENGTVSVTYEGASVDR